MTTLTTLRAAVIARAESRGLTAYAIARDAERLHGQTVVSEDHVRRYLTGTGDMTSEKLDAVLAVLGLRVS